MDPWREPEAAKILFCSKELSEVSDFDFALEAVHQLGLVNDSAALAIAEMIDSATTEHTRAITTRYRKSGPQVTNEVKKQLGIRANSFLSIAAYAELSELGRKRALDAHEITLRRAAFHKAKARTLGQCIEYGFDKVRFRPSHRDECEFCRENDNVILYVSEISELPISKCSREACSAFISPYQDYLGRQN